MIHDTLRQKFIYNTPYDKNEFPLVNLDKSITKYSKDVFKIKASELYFIEAKEFEKLIAKINVQNILIENDYNFKSKNKILLNGAICHIKAFVYLFEKNGFKCNVIK